MHQSKVLIDLRLIAPHVAFSVTKTFDPHFRWDGDGPDPSDDDLFPHTIDFSASVIVCGELVTGAASLGGSYFREEEPVGDAHGYLAQELLDALDDLPDLHLEDVGDEIKEAKAYLKAHMRNEWERQQKQKP